MDLESYTYNLEKQKSEKFERDYSREYGDQHLNDFYFNWILTKKK